MPTITVFDNQTREDPRSLVPVDWNTQERTADELQAIKDSIKVHGLVGPIAARPSDRSIAGGHGRLEAILELITEGWELDGGTVPVVWKECDDAELMALNMALNNATGQPNFQKVAIAIQRIESLGRLDLIENRATGFTPLQVRDIQVLATTPAALPGRAEKNVRETESDTSYDESLADSMAAPEMPGGSDGYEWSIISFSVADDMKTVIDAALAKARQVGNTTNDAVALTLICADFLGTPDEAYE